MESPFKVRVEVDGPVRLEIWHLPQIGWDDWAAGVDRFLAHAISTLHARSGNPQIEEIHLNLWPDGGRLIVFVSAPVDSRDPPGAGYLEMDADYVAETYADFGTRLDAANAQDPEHHPIALAWEQWERQLWSRIGECLSSGRASTALCELGQKAPVRIRATNWSEDEQRLEEVTARQGDGSYVHHPAPRNTRQFVVK